MITNHIPRRDIGSFFGDLLHREQSLGEIRGLQRLINIIIDRRKTLESTLGLIPDPPQPNQD